MLILPYVGESLQSRSDGSWKYITAFNELTPEQLSELSKSLRQWNWLAMKRDEFKESELDILKNLQSEMDFTDKPMSQRMRGVLYRLWEAKNDGYNDFQLYYNYHMEKIINHLKSKLP